MKTNQQSINDVFLKVGLTTVVYEQRLNADYIVIAVLIF